MFPFVKRALMARRTSPIHWYNVAVLRAGVAELVDAPDSKSGDARASCRFEPDLRYRLLESGTREGAGSIRHEDTRDACALPA